MARAEAIDSCPRCGGELELVAHVPAVAAEPDTPTTRRLLPRRVDVIADNLRSVYNVGSMFRTADGAGLHHVHLCGITPTPVHPKLAKTALGAERVVAWSYHPDAVALVEAEQAHGTSVWALEPVAEAIPLQTCLLDIVDDTAQAIALVVGNENAGVDPAILAGADRIVRLPMYGMKRSLNVATAFGAAAYLLAQAVDDTVGAA